MPFNGPGLFILCSKKNMRDIIVFGEYLKLGISLRRTTVIAYYNSGFIRSCPMVFSLQGEKVFYINICVLVCD